MVWTALRETEGGVEEKGVSKREIAGGNERKERASRGGDFFLKAGEEVRSDESGGQNKGSRGALR